MKNFRHSSSAGKGYLTVLHTLTLRRKAKIHEIVKICGLDQSEVETALRRGTSDGTVKSTGDGDSVITSRGRELLDDVYPRMYNRMRADPAVAAAYDEFEAGVNRRLLRLVTQWQTVDINGRQVANDHSDLDYDMKILDQLDALHQRVTRVLQPLAKHESRVERCLDRLGEALFRAGQGETEYVSGPRVASYHSLWFELHEDVLRMLGKTRQE